MAEGQRQDHPHLAHYEWSAVVTIAFVASAVSGVAALVDQRGEAEVVIVPADAAGGIEAVTASYGLFAAVTLLVLGLEVLCVVGGALLLGTQVHPRAWAVLGLLGGAGAAGTALGLARGGSEAEPYLALMLVAFAVLVAAAAFESWRARLVCRVSGPTSS